ncbi:MAG: hypothetical protein II551_01465 [Paludibacteraceae bacterium]|nr:hypothetical protein [Paludibacteraceae bacterium]
MTRTKELIISVLLIFSVAGHAGNYRDKDEHYVTLDGGVGYHTLLTTGDLIDKNYGLGMRIGVGYRYQWDVLLLHIGIEGQYGYTYCNLGSVRDSAAYDFGGLQGTRIGEVNQRHDVYRMANVGLPLLVGAGFGPIYLLTGVKPSLNLWGSAKSEAHLSTWVDYYGPVPGTTDDRFLQSSEGKSESMQWNWQLYAHLELGARFRLPRPSGTEGPRMAVAWAVWADYGIFNAYTASEPLEAVSMEDPYKSATIRPALKGATDIQSHPLTVGVKMTLLFNVGKDKSCVLCEY